MKIINLFKQELKTKWSSRLFVALVVLVVSSVFGSSFLLKREYDLVEKEPEGRFKGYKKLVNQPFTHIKTTGGTVSQINIEAGDEPTVLVKNRGQNWATMAEKIFVRNDTLFVNLDKQGANDPYYYPSRNATITIVAPNIQSIDADDSYITVGIWQQKSMTVNLLNGSIFETNRPIDSLNFCKISMANFSKFTINNYIGFYNNRHNGDENQTGKHTNILAVEANLRDSCELQLGNTNIQNFKLNATQGNKIELSSETMNALMKK